jgi:hypothetical protein
MKVSNSALRNKQNKWAAYVACIHTVFDMFQCPSFWHFHFRKLLVCLLISPCLSARINSKTADQIFMKSDVEFCENLSTHFNFHLLSNKNGHHTKTYVCFYARLLLNSLNIYGNKKCFEQLL